MSEDGNTAIIRRWLDEVWNQRRDATIDELLDAHAVGHLEGMTTRNVDEFKKARSYLLGAFPDFHVSCDAILSQGDHVIARWSARGTHRGNLLQIPPTGTGVKFHGITWFTLSNGRIVEGWDVWNQGKLFAQLEATAQALSASA